MEKKQSDKKHQEGTAKDIINTTKDTAKKTVQIRLVGSSHIAQQSIDDVKKNIINFKPDIVAVELDARRLEALLDNEKNNGNNKQKVPISLIFKIGVVGYIFAKFGSWGSKKLGKLVGVEPGEEMLTAVKLAREKGIKLALIDQPIEITLARFSAKITLREKLRFVKDLIYSIFFAKKAAKEIGIDINSFDLRKVPSAKIIKQLVNVMKTKYPNAYLVLVDERNRIMAHNLIRLSKTHQKILAVVGAGHLEGIKSEMDKLMVANS
ncbi:TraB/GumN family protein [Candidatus Woesearchaeota archaeon]|nr:TraB/GumN family protein [Candidatus Woesearchaeota archaeon]